MVKVINQKTTPPKGSEVVEQETQKAEKAIMKKIDVKDENFDAFAAATDLAMDNIKDSMRLRELDTLRAKVTEKFFDYPLVVSRQLMARIEDDMRIINIDMEARSRSIKNLIK